MRLEKLSLQFAMHETGLAGDVLEAYERVQTTARSAVAGARVPAWFVGAEIDPPTRRPERLAATVRARLARSEPVGCVAIVARSAGPSLPCMRMTSRVSSSRCERTRERSTSSVSSPPALRRICASPESSPKIRKVSMRESIQVTIATCFAGTRARGPSKSASSAEHCRPGRRFRSSRDEGFLNEPSDRFSAGLVP